MLAVGASTVTAPVKAPPDLGIKDVNSVLSAKVALSVVYALASSFLLTSVLVA